jgi:flagellar hook-length control protein FliK
MSAVSLPLSAELSACVTDAANASPATGFTELLSTAAACFGVAAQPEAVEDRGPTAPLPAVAQTGTMADMAQAADAVLADDATPATCPPQEYVDAAIARRPFQSTMPATTAETDPAGEPAIALAAAMVLATPQSGSARGGPARTLRLREADKEPAAARREKQPTGEPSSWTIQQALAAVAAIAVPPPPAARAAILPGGNVPSERALPMAAMPAGDQPASSLLPGGRDGSDDRLNSPTPALHAAASLATSVDTQVLGAALMHAKPLGSVPHLSPASANAVATNVDPELQQLDALMRDIASLSGTSGRAAFRLTADQLGPLDVRLHSSDAGVAVTIRTHDDQSRATVAQAQHQLNDDMRANGLKVAATNVTLGGGSADRERHDRPNAPLALPIEAAPLAAEQSQSTNELRPDGRYA